MRVGWNAKCHPCCVTWVTWVYARWSLASEEREILLAMEVRQCSLCSIGSEKQYVEETEEPWRSSIKTPRTSFDGEQMVLPSWFLHPATHWGCLMPSWVAVTLFHFHFGFYCLDGLTNPVWDLEITRFLLSLTGRWRRPEFKSMRVGLQFFWWPLEASCCFKTRKDYLIMLRINIRHLWAVGYQLAASYLLRYRPAPQGHHCQDGDGQSSDFT